MPDLLKGKLQDCEAEITQPEQVCVIPQFFFVLACDCGVVHLCDLEK